MYDLEAVTPVLPRKSSIYFQEYVFYREPCKKVPNSSSATSDSSFRKRLGYVKRESCWKIWTELNFSDFISKGKKNRKKPTLVLHWGENKDPFQLLRSDLDV